MELKQLRKTKNITQQQCADFLGVPLRTYLRYENDETKRQTLKYRYMVEKLEQYGFVDEEHGLLTLDDIKAACEKVFSAYPVEYCYLFGSYAKNRATEKSDVDLLICTSVTGLQFYGLVEDLRNELKKKTDVLNLAQLENNSSLINEILKVGIKIYG